MKKTNFKKLFSAGGIFSIFDIFNISGIFGRTSFFFNIPFRPVILFLLIYICFIIFADGYGFFLPEKNSFLFTCTSQKKVTLIGKVISEPVLKKRNQQFIMEVSDINGQKIKKEKTLVSARKNYPVQYGDILRLTGKINIPEKPVFPYVFDYNKYLQRQNIYTSFYQYGYELVDRKPNIIKKLSLKLRNDIEARIDRYFKPPCSSILKSMIVGDKAALDKDTKDAFVNTGLIHILVISGLHIGFCAAIFLFFFKLFGLKLKYVYLLTIPALFFYTLMTGANPPAVRASIMASCVLVAFMLDREPLIYNALSLSALIILILNPQDLFTASFQLSFFATFGIIYFYPKFRYAFGKIKNKFLSSFWEVSCVTLSAQFALIPILIFYFGKISIISFVLNLVIVPLIPFIIILSLVFYVFSFISSFLAVPAAFILTYLLKSILYIINFSSNLSFAVVWTAIPSLGLIIFYYAAFFIMLKFKNNKKVLFCLFLAICFMLINPFEEKNFVRNFIGPKNLTTHIRTADGKDFIVTQEFEQDRFYERNLRQYLLACGSRKTWSL